MEEKKTEDRNLENGTVNDEVLNENPTGEEAPEAEEKEERRGLFGAKKRERNEKMVMGLYAVAGVYLLYTAYMTAKELIEGKVEPGKDTIISGAFVVVFGVAAIWILYTSWKLRNALKAQEKEEAEKLAAEMAERGEKPEEPAKGGLFGGLLTKTEVGQPSVASRASVYYNPADEDEESDGESDGPEEAGEDGASGEEGLDSKDRAKSGAAEDEGEASAREADEESGDKE